MLSTQQWDVTPLPLKLHEAEGLKRITKNVPDKFLNISPFLSLVRWQEVKHTSCWMLLNQIQITQPTEVGGKKRSSEYKKALNSIKYRALGLSSIWICLIWNTQKNKGGGHKFYIFTNLCKYQKSPQCFEKRREFAAKLYITLCI